MKQKQHPTDSISDWFFKHKIKIFYGYLAIVIALLGYAAQVHFVVEIEEIIDSNFKSYNEEIQLFPAEKNIYLLLSNSKNHFTNAEVCQINDWWVKQLKRNRKLESTFASFEASKFGLNKNNISIIEYVKYNCDDSQASEPVDLSQINDSPWKGLLLPKSSNNEIFISFSFFRLENRGLFGFFNWEAVGELYDSFEKSPIAQNSEVTATWGGLGVYFFYLVKGYFYSMLLNTLTVLLVCVLLALWFRSALTGVLFYILYQLVLFPVLSLMGAFGFDMDTLSNTLPIMLLLACLQDFIFISYYYKKDLSAFKTLMIPGFFTSLTTAVGFGSLIAADLTIIRRFGLITGVASLLEFFVMFLVFPGLLEMKLFKKWSPRAFASSLKPKALLIPKPLAYLLLVLPLLTLTQIDKLNMEDYPENLFPKSHPIQQGSEVFLKKFGWKSITNLLYEEESADFVNLKVLPKILENPIVSQAENFDSIVSEFSDPSEPMNKEIMASLFEDTGYARKLFHQPTDRKRTILYLNSSVNADVTKLWNQVERLCKDQCQLVGDLISYTEFSNRVITGFHKSILTSLALVFLIIFTLCLYRREPRTVSLLFCSLWGPLMLLSLFITLQIPVFFVTSIVVSIVAGLTGDNALFFLLSDSKKEASEQAKNISSISTTVVAFYLITLSTLLFSYFGAIRTLSALLLAGLILSLFGDISLFLSLKNQKLPASQRKR